MCDYCCGKHQVNIYDHKDNETGIGEYVYVDENILAIEVYQGIGGFSVVIREPINHCPMCGRKLKEVCNG